MVVTFIDEGRTEDRVALGKSVQTPMSLGLMRCLYFHMESCIHTIDFSSIASSSPFINSKNMSAAQRIPVLAGTLGIGAVVAAISTIPALRNLTSRYLSFSAPGGIWRILAILFALINLKNLPFLWHVSIVDGLFVLYHPKTYQVY